MPSNSELHKLLSMVMKNSETKVTINNQDFSSFNDVVIKRTSDGGTVVMIDGIPAVGDEVSINIEVNGDVDSITLENGTVRCNNVHNGIKTVSGDVYCVDVYGNATTTSGDIECQDVGGNVTTVSGDVNSNEIAGNVSTISGDIY